MRIKVEKTCKGNCLNICPRDKRIRVGSYYCLTMCKHFFAKKIMNDQEEVICNFIEKSIDEHFDNVTPNEVVSKLEKLEGKINVK